MSRHKFRAPTPTQARRATAAAPKRYELSPGTGPAAGRIRAALVHLNASRLEQGEAEAVKAIEIDETDATAWRLVGICREKRRDLANALLCYERALALKPGDASLPNDLGRLAIALKQYELADAFLSRHLAACPGDPPAVSNLADAWRLQGRFDEAIDLLRDHIQRDPGQARYWHTLGALLVDRGDLAQAVVFLDEAIRLDSSVSMAPYGRATCKMGLGDQDAALADNDLALASKNLAPTDIASMRVQRALILMCAGRVGEAWDAYEARKDPATSDYLQFVFRGPEWTAGDPVEGRRLLVSGEQGLGDEVMFASMLPDLLRELGPEGHMLLAVEPRMAPLMQRSFPEATVVEHATVVLNSIMVRSAPGSHAERYDGWLRIGSLARAYRRSLEAFPPEAGYLKPDPGRVEHWRETLAGLGAGPKVGVIWKSLKMDGGRSRYFAAFDHWKGVLQTPGVTFVNLQYGDCAEDLAHARAAFGVDIVQPPGIDLKDDLDDLAALCAALDLVVGPATATTNIAGAVGAPLWMISVPDAWPRLGSDRYPWYPQAEVFAAGYDWSAVMPQIADALRARFPSGAQS